MIFGILLHYIFPGKIIIDDPVRQLPVIFQPEKFHSIFSKRKVVQQFGANRFLSEKRQHIIKKSGVGPEYMG